jgi:hypothetical protein
MNESIKLAGAAVLGAGVGFVVGYKLLEKKLGASFDERLAEETKDMREVYQNLKQPYASPEEAVKSLILPKVADGIKVNGKTQYHKVIPEQEEVTEKVVQNVFDGTGPRLVSQDDFMTNEPGHEQATLTYYEGSDQLCGEADDPIDNEEIVVGLEYKSKFGWKSSDEHTVHVRNLGLHMDFEIVKSEGSYEQEVLGEGDPSIPPHKRVRLEGR